MKKILVCLIVILTASEVSAAEYNNEIGNGRDSTNVVLLGPINTKSSSEIIFSEQSSRFGTYSGISIRHNSTNGDLVFERNELGSVPLFSLKTKLTALQLKTTPMLELGANTQAFASLGTAFVGALPTTTGSPTVAAFGHMAQKSSNQYAIAQSSTGELRINAPTTNTISFYSGGSNKHTTVNYLGEWVMEGRLNIKNDIKATSANFESLRIGGTAINASSLLVNEQASLDNLRDARIASGVYSTYIGVGAGGLSGNGMHNAALGHNALSKGGSTSYNTALGSHALSLLVSGQFNTAVGLGALQSLVTGSQNTVMGQGAMVSATSTTGSTALGWSALYSLQSGYNNIAIGLEAADSMRSGDNNIFIGKDVQGSAYTGNPYALYSANNELNIGNLLKGSLKAGSKALTVNGNLTVTDKLTIAGGLPAAGAVLIRLGLLLKTLIQLMVLVLLMILVFSMELICGSVPILLL
jgi:hypothetical protein